MLWIRYIVSISHFAECRENWPVTVREMLINLLKSHIPQWQGKWKKWSGTESPPKVNQFFILVGSNITQNFNEIG